MPQVSIIVPIYNTEAFLPRCIASIEAQTFRDFECILVDDGSPDGSGALCDEQARRDARFRVIHRANGGLSAARNSGMEAACGEYLVFCDSDDQLHPRLLELALTVQAQRPGQLVTWRFASDAAGWAAPLPEAGALPLTSYHQSQMLRYFADRQLFNSACNKLYPRVFLQQRGLWFDVNAYGIEDYVFFNAFWRPFFAADPTAGICQIDLPLYCYSQQNTASITHTAGASNTGEFEGYCAEQLRLFSETKAVFDPFYGYPAPDIARVMSVTLQSIAYGLCQLPAPRQELVHLRQAPELREIARWHKQQHVHNLFLTFLRLRWMGGLRWWLRVCETSPALYANVYWLGYRRFRENVQ